MNFCTKLRTSFSGDTIRSVAYCAVMLEVWELMRQFSKYRDSIFRVPNFDRWIVILNKPQYIEDIKRVPESTLSATEPLNEVCGKFHADSGIRILIPLPPL